MTDKSNQSLILITAAILRQLFVPSATAFVLTILLCSVTSIESRPPSCELKSKTVEQTETVIIQKTKFCNGHSGERCSTRSHVKRTFNDTIYECCDGYAAAAYPGQSLKCLPLRCSRCVYASRCDEINDTCTCEDGWMGEYCNEPCCCYGEDCAEKICKLVENAVRCDPETRKFICMSGYYGEKCERVCPNGFDCNEKCQPGFFGQKCQQKCQPISNDSRVVSESCDWVTGSYECEPGYRGDICNEPCQAGFYGKQCKEKCNCGPYEVCTQTGVCVCALGTIETNSSLTRSNCLNPNQVYCNPNNGSCTCKPGWTGNSCEKACQKGFYGQNCANRCPSIRFDSHAVISEECDPVTGKYSCKPKFFGNLCNKICDCSNGACRQINGTCLDFSHNKMIPSIAISILPYLIGLSTFLVLFTVINLIFIICRYKIKCKRRMTQTYYAKDRSYKPIEIEKHHYEEISIYEPGDTYDFLEFQQAHNSHHKEYDKIDKSFNFQTKFNK